MLMIAAKKHHTEIRFCSKYKIETNRDANELQPNHFIFLTEEINAGKTVARQYAILEKIDI